MTANTIQQSRPDTDTLRAELISLSEPEYRQFMAALIPSVDSGRVLGVRTPKLKALAKQLGGTREAEDFLTELPHGLFEEDQLHAFLLGNMRDFNACIDAVDHFLLYVDNWATCDQLSPPVFGTEPEKLLPHLARWLESGRTYTVRFGMGMLMRYFLDRRFQPEYPEMIVRAAKDNEGDYYVEMMAAWYFATALAKQYDTVIPYLEERRLNRNVHNRSIQKAAESRRISGEKKDYLKKLRWHKDE